MPQETLASRRRAIACRRFFVNVVAAGLACLPSAILHTQAPPVHGYITAVHPPDGFDVNGEHVITTAETQYGLIGMKNLTDNGPMRDALHIGAWVEVSGGYDRKAKTVAARMVLFRDDRDNRLNGLGVIDHVISTAPELVFAADGYRIRVTAATEVKFPRDVKSAADVYAGMWVLYEGKMGQDGLLVASKARFVSTDHPKAKSEKAPSGSSAPAATSQPPLNTSGRTEVQIAVSETEVQIGDDTYRVSKDHALQSRVSQIGLNLVPTSILVLPVNDPAKIHFSFIAVDNGAHEVLTFPDSKGLILVPAQLAARFKNDDQLAAVLADGIAYSLQLQAPTVIQFNRTTLAEAAGLAAAGLVPYGYLAAGAAGSVYSHEMKRALQEQRGRVALQLMADAGYHPWQAPEAWRLAASGKLPTDTSTLKYPERSGYQFAILNLMYKKFAPTNATASGPTANSGASGKP